MNSLIVKRTLAFFIDYFVLAFYGAMLFAIAYQFKDSISGPIQGQLIGFLFLTIPVVLYFYFFESSPKRGTIGKQVFKIKIASEQNLTKKSILLRIVFMLIPWEVAHSGVHWQYYFQEQGMSPPWYIWALSIIPQIVVLIYFGSLGISKGSQTLYDKWAGIKIISI